MTDDIPGRKRILYRIKLSTKAGQELEGLSWQLSMPKNTLMARLIRWFCRQHPLFRQLIVGAIPPDQAANAAQQVLAETRCSHI